MSMTPEQQKKFNTLFGTICLVGGLLTWGFAAYYAFTPAEPVPAPVLARSVSQADCTNTLQGLGMTVLPTADSKGLRVTQPPPLSESEVVPAMLKFDLASTICEYPVKRICIGSSCDASGNMVIELDLPAK